ncbi:conserved domain protein [Ruminococcus albus 8]|uniref:Conserved domain protein n=1 Tax=Ruminococcus albus 8 TaxID=246199 RepID=E9SAR0_RUMAL|nr:conserved domain protein [Ruminococcus albus 8]
MVNGIKFHTYPAHRYTHSTQSMLIAVSARGLCEIFNVVYYIYYPFNCGSTTFHFSTSAPQSQYRQTGHLRYAF